MTPEQIVDVVARYERDLTGRGVVPDRLPPSLLPSAQTGLKHALWMCGEVRRQVMAGQVDKAMRWLGFVQGVLWMAGVSTIDSMREDNSTMPDTARP